MGISEDGNADDENEDSDNERASFSQSKERSPSNVYVSILDPVGEPAFKPSNSKPLPKWMSLLPRNVYGEKRPRRQVKPSKPNVHTLEMESLDGHSPSVSECYSSKNNVEDPPAPPPTEIAPKRLPRVMTAAILAPIDIPGAPEAARKSRMTISIDRKREYGLDGMDHQQSTYIAPPECPPSTLLGREKTPYPLILPTSRRPSMPRSETTSYFSHGFPRYHIPDPNVDRNYGRGPEERKEGSDTNLLSDSTSPYWTILSSEYLERYKPKSAETSYKTYIAKEREPVMERIRRQKVGRQSTGEVKETVEKRESSNKRLKYGGEEYGLEARREDLQKELRNLFCEE